MLKHAQAGTASVLLENRTTSVKLIVEDDGVGFDPGSGHQGGRARLGLSGIRERLRLVGGSLEVESAQGAGHDALRRHPAPTIRPGMTRLRLALADDHPVVLAGVKSLLQATPDMDVVGEAVTGLAALDMIRTTIPDVAVIDISMPDLTGIELARCLARDCPAVRLLALTVHEDQAYLQQMLSAGARGYLLKRSAADELVRAVRAVAAGGLFLDPAIAGEGIRTLDRAKPVQHRGRPQPTGRRRAAATPPMG